MLVLGMTISSACSFNAVNSLNFKPSQASFGKERSVLVPKLYSDKDLSLSFFGIQDSTILSYVPSKAYFLMAQDVFSGDTLLNLCRRGRGNGEFLMVAPRPTLKDGHAYVVDNMKSSIVDVDITSSLKTGKTESYEIASLSNDKDRVLHYNVAIKTDDNYLVSYHHNTAVDTPSLQENPMFRVHDLNTGELVLTKYLFKNLTDKWKEKYAMYVGHLCGIHGHAVPGSTEVCFAMLSLPVIGFFDYKTGELRGMNFKNLPKFKIGIPRYYFFDMAVDEEYIYALLDESLSPVDSEDHDMSLVVMDYSGYVRGYYDLVGSFGNMELSCGKLFFQKQTDPGRLYYIDTKLLNL